MTVTTSANKVVFLGNGATTIFTYSFPITAANEVVLTFTDAAGNQTVIAPTAYTITGINPDTTGNAPFGGTVTYPTSGAAIALGTTLTLQRVVAYTQETSLANQGGMWPTVVESADDVIVFQTQQLAEQAARAVSGNVADPATVNLTLPPVAQRANQLLGFDGSGNAIAAQPASAIVSTVMQPVVSASTNLEAWQALFPPNTVQYYVSPTGSDSNDGLTPASPFQTIAKAASLAAQYFTGGSSDVFINLAHGTYTAGAIFVGLLGASAVAANSSPGSVVIRGDLTSPASVIVQDTTGSPATFMTMFDATLSLEGLTIKSTLGSGVFPSYGSTITIGSNVIFGDCTLGMTHAETGGSVNFLGGVTIAGNAPAFIQNVLGGRTIFFEGNQTVVLQGTPAFSTAFAIIENGSLVYCPSPFVTFSGSATGIRFWSRSNSCIDTLGGAPDYFPGSSQGLIDDGGCYLPAGTPTLTAVTGLGTGGFASLGTGANNRVGLIQLNTGSTGTQSTGSITLTLSACGGANGFAPTFTFGSGTGAWEHASTVVTTSETTIQVTFEWTNGSTALATNSTFIIFYTITPY